MLDANYVVFFRGNIDKDGMKKLFNLTNKAFGEDANRLTEGDFKKISFAAASEPTDDTSVEDPVEDTSAKDAEEDVEEVVDPDSTTIDDEVDEIVNEGKSTKLDEDVEIDSSIDAYVFLKITTK